MCLKQPLGILMNEHLVKIKYYCNEKTLKCKVANSQEMADGTVGCILQTAQRSLLLHVPQASQS